MKLQSILIHLYSTSFMWDTKSKIVDGNHKLTSTQL